MKNNILHKKKGFSLTELIMVVSILVIMAALGILAYSSHAIMARDASRIKQSQEISDGFELYATRKRLPAPEDSIEILVNGTTIGYQGYAGETTLNQIDYYGGGKDPIDKSYKNRRKKNPFTYYMTKDSKQAQILTFLENQETLSFFPQTYAADYIGRTPKVSGSRLGVLTDVQFNSPIQEVGDVISVGQLDIGITTTSYTAHISDEEKITGDFQYLTSSAPSASCKRLADRGKKTGNMMYRINPDGLGYVEVYCNMDITNGGWMLIGSKNSSGNQTRGDFGTLVVNKGENSNMNIVQDEFLNGLSQGLVCSSENCWKWDLSDIFKGCIKNDCPSSVTDNNDLVRVKGTTGFALGTTDRIWYNTADTRYMFAIFTTGGSYVSPSTGAWNLRVGMDGNLAAAWAEGDEWNLYVR